MNLVGITAAAPTSKQSVSPMMQHGAFEDILSGQVAAAEAETMASAQLSETVKAEENVLEVDLPIIDVIQNLTGKNIADLTASPSGSGSVTGTADALRLALLKPSNKTEQAVASAEPETNAPDYEGDNKAALPQGDLPSHSRTVPNLAPAHTHSNVAVQMPTGENYSLNISATSAPVHSPSALNNNISVEPQQLLMTQAGDWIDVLAQEISSNKSSERFLTFTLTPKNLGQLDIAFTIDGGQVHLQLQTTTAAAADIISENKSQLTQSLSESGLKLGQFDMSNRQNSGNRQDSPTPQRQDEPTTITSTQPLASSDAQARFA